MVPMVNGKFGVPRISPALEHATEVLIKGLGEHGYDSKQLWLLRANAHTSQVDIGYSLTQEVTNCLPNPEELIGIFNNASTVGTGITAVCEQFYDTILTVEDYGPMKHLNRLATSKVRA